jgi:hypothetical protein
MANPHEKLVPVPLQAKAKLAARISIKPPLVTVLPRVKQRLIAIARLGGKIGLSAAPAVFTHVPPPPPQTMTMLPQSADSVTRWARFWPQGGVKPGALS